MQHAKTVICVMPSRKIKPNPNRLYQAQSEIGLTQEEAAEQAGLTRNSISRYETGSVNPSTLALKMLSTIYNKPVEWFFYNDVFIAAASDKDVEFATDLDTIMSEPELMLRNLRSELSDQAIQSIANFIKFLHSEESGNER